MNKKWDLLVVGKGPAGVSAAIYAARGGLEVLVIAKDGGALEKAAHIENYYGTGLISGKELLKKGEEQIVSLGVELRSEEVLSLGFAPDGWLVITDKGEYEGKNVLLATGVQRSAPKIPGLKELEGHGVSYCAVCDGFFFRNKGVAVIGGGEYALHEASVLLPLASSVTLLTNGQPIPENLPENLKADDRPIQKLVGETRLEQVEFASGEPLSVAGIFVAVGTAGGNDLARKAGVPIQNNLPMVDENQMSPMPGLYLAGDLCGGMLQIAKAVYEGAKVGSHCVKQIKSEATKG